MKDKTHAIPNIENCKTHHVLNEKTTGELLSILSDTHSSKELDHYLENYTFPENHFSFSYAFAAIIEKKKLSKAEIIRRSNLDRTYAYQILNGTKLPGRDKILALSIAASLSLRETQRMLECAEEGILYSRSSRDAVIIYGIEHHLTILQINELLDKHGENPLS